ncbi:SDR family oxidoreductase [Actinoallomurus purpureus]|uniref:SDR family NAD(P)-dependent oxidoreductase n=1 Tax=Actinoallomurus purpureus TaxID=478114 RepID=UPI0020936A93|nr:SDR family oxidoreductase [Actinoallomurus purpureus]MCO6008042.1 SDR family oxidoreductase [Actinoallomurus purpureus]
MELQNKTALITGASSGIGRETAKLFAAEGASVVVAGRRENLLVDLVEEIRGDGGTARYVVADVSNLDDVNRLAEEAGDVDVLVNNAGVFPFALTDEQTVENFDLLFNTNVRGPYFLTAAVVKKMKAKGSGSVIVTTSIAGIEGMAHAGVYGGTKAALASIVRSWASEFGKDGIRVNAVAPGNVRTDAVIDVLGEEAFEEWGRTGNPVGRLGVPREIAETILFLASPRSSYLTGQEIAVDGGYTTSG